MKKLVRDKIPEQIVESGRIPRVRYLQGEEYLSALLGKLLEEASEFRLKPSIEEFVDIMEVVAAIRAELAFSADEIEAAAIGKRAAKGGFSRHSFIDEIIDPSEQCDFCREFSTGFCPPLEGPRVLYETDNFVVFPALGSFIEGYLLICPKVHIPSYAWLTHGQTVEFERVLAKIQRVLSSEYTAPILFEHGSSSSSCCTRSGACIDHAHVHVVPTSVSMANWLRSYCEPRALKSWSDLREWREEPYLLYGAQTGDLLVYRVKESLPSQFLRRYLADALGCPDLWDWGAYIGRDEIQRTLLKLSHYF
jgi:predicted house-cleaning noncanonical NTP pyrophosphatase (MazG superfamily)/diadenosine tetraphosphate (Ap4A) HIT family hydrolase